MLSYQKNKLLNLILQFEIAINQYYDEQWQDGDQKILLSLETINRNIQSIKKQINKL